MSRGVRSYASFLGPHFGRERRSLVLLAILIMAGLVGNLAGPRIVRMFVDLATRPEPVSLSTLTLVAGAFLIIGVLVQLLSAARGILGATVAWRATNRLRDELVGHTLSLDLGLHRSVGPGAMVERIDGDVRALNRFFADLAVQLVVNALTVIGVLVVVMVVDWRVGLAMLAFCLVSVCAVRITRGRGTPAWRRAREASSSLYGRLQEIVSGTADLRGRGALDWGRHQFASRLLNSIRLTRRASTLSAVLSHGVSVVLDLGTVAMLAVAAWLSLRGDLTLGDVLQLTMYAALVSSPLRAIASQVSELQSASACVDRCRELLDQEPSLRPGLGLRPFRSSPSLELRDVTFRYPLAQTLGESPEQDGPDPVEDPAGLRNVSLMVPAGTSLGLLGRTGAGKSTVLRLSARLYDPDTGCVLVDGQDLRTATFTQLRDTIGVLSQDVNVFEASVRENLTMFDSSVPDSTLHEALRRVGLVTWLQMQSDGLDTLMDAGSPALSAGEAQLFSIARVFVANPPVLLLDEPTAGLDPANEAAVVEALQVAMVDRTCVVVAHRLATLAAVDQLALVNAGAVVEIGPRAVVMADEHSRIRRAIAEHGTEVVS